MLELIFFTPKSTKCYSGNELVRVQPCSHDLFYKIVLFPKLDDNKDLRFISSNQVEMSLKHDA